MDVASPCKYGTFYFGHFFAGLHMSCNVLITLLFMGLLLLGCVNEGSGSGSSIKDTEYQPNSGACELDDSGCSAADRELSGAWLSNCIAFPSSNDESEDVSFRQTLIFEAGSIGVVDSDFSGLNCTGSAVDAIYAGSYTLGEDVTATDGTEVTRLSFSAFPISGASGSSLSVSAAYRVTGDELVLATSGTASTPELDTSYTYHKQ